MMTAIIYIWIEIKALKISRLHVSELKYDINIFRSHFSFQKLDLALLNDIRTSQEIYDIYQVEQLIK